LGGTTNRIDSDDRPTAAVYGHEDVSAMQSWLVDPLPASLMLDDARR
jgi:hypothetical protein